MFYYFHVSNAGAITITLFRHSVNKLIVESNYDFHIEPLIIYQLQYSTNEISMNLMRERIALKNPFSTFVKVI